MNVSVHNYSLDNLSNARHTYDVKDEDYVTLNVDWKQAGIGGDDSWTPSIHPQYLLGKGKYQYRFRVKVLDPETGHAGSGLMV